MVSARPLRAEIDVELGKLRERELLKVKLAAETEAEKDWVAAIKAKNAEKRRRWDAKGFQKIPLLPMELQVMIWKEVIKNKPTDFWEEYSYIGYDGTTVDIHPWVYAYLATRRGPPAVMATCRLSRLLALKAWIKHVDY